MRAGQTLVANDGYEVALFPLEYINISQGENGGTSHQGSYAVDFLGWGSNGRVYQCPCYAPCKIKVVYASSGTYRIFESVNKVHLADGSLDYLTIWFSHCDDNSPYYLGRVINQGEQCNSTGTNGNVTGDHSHIICKKGRYTGQTLLPSGHWTLTGQSHIYNCLYVNDTTIVNGYGYNWRTYSGGVTPDYRKYKFKWVLYANKLRKRSVL